MFKDKIYKTGAQININKSTTALQILTEYKINDKIQQCYYCRSQSKLLKFLNISQKNYKYICITCCSNIKLK